MKILASQALIFDPSFNCNAFWNLKGQPVLENIAIIYAINHAKVDTNIFVIDFYVEEVEIDDLENLV